MIVDKIEVYRQQLDKLDEIIDATNKRILLEEDALFSDNVNFFTKSYLINLCAITEACLKDIALEIVGAMSMRMSDAKVSSNIIMWSVFKEGYDEKKHSKLGDFLLDIVEQDIGRKLSANPWKAVKLFKVIGCEIDVDENFSAVKNIIFGVVEKRNKIVHHNDEANDISMADVKSYIKFFRVYLNCVARSSIDVVEFKNDNSNSAFNYFNAPQSIGLLN